jgi:hypothetical protein
MPWEPFELSNRSGEPLSDDDRAIILRALERALQSSDIGIEKLLAVARKIGSNIGHIKDLGAYSTTAFSRTVKQQKIAFEKETELLEPLQPYHVDERRSSASAIEQQTLLRQLLDRLGGLERDIYLARLKGHEFAKIDKAFDLKPGTSENRYRQAARRLAR